MKALSLGAAATIRNLELASRSSPIVVMMRHSNRYDINDPAEVYTVGLTLEGIQLAEEFGKHLKRKYTLGLLSSAPVQRCIDTAVAIAKGAGWKKPVYSDDLISYPTIETAWLNLPGFHPGDPIPESIRAIRRTFFIGNREAGSLNLCVTHDSVLACTLGYLTGKSLSLDEWPDFLEGAVFWKEHSKLMAVWRGNVHNLGKTIDF